MVSFRKKKNLSDKNPKKGKTRGRAKDSTSVRIAYPCDQASW